jgi:hypothetical protein
MSEEDHLRVIAMMRIQCTADEIAGVMGISVDTLDRRIKERGHAGFADLYKKHQSEGRTSLRRAQFKSAVEDGNPTMLIWLGKQTLGQRDKHEHEVTGKDGGPIAFSRARSKLADLLASEDEPAQEG